MERCSKSEQLLHLSLHPQFFHSLFLYTHRSLCFSSAWFTSSLSTFLLPFHLWKPKNHRDRRIAFCNPLKRIESSISDLSGVLFIPCFLVFLFIPYSSVSLLTFRSPASPRSSPISLSAAPSFPSSPSSAPFTVSQQLTEPRDQPRPPRAGQTRSLGSQLLFPRKVTVSRTIRAELITSPRSARVGEREQGQAIWIRPAADRSRLQLGTATTELFTVSLHRIWSMHISRNGRFDRGPAAAPGYSFARDAANQIANCGSLSSV